MLLKLTQMQETFDSVIGRKHKKQSFNIQKWINKT